MSELESREDIDRLVAQLLNEAGARNRFPTPVDDIVAAQQLRISSSHDSPFAPDVIAAAPASLRSRLRAFQGKLLGALARQERAMYLAPDILEVQRRFIACHEAGHDLCPWQAVRYQLDGWEQLDLGIREKFEQEANYAAVGLLFQQDIFLQVTASYPLGAATVKQVAELFGASIHATFWQYVEQSPEPMLGLILSRSPSGVDATSYRFHVKNALASPSFTRLSPSCDTPPRWLASADYPALATAWEHLRTSEVAAGYLHLPTYDGHRYLLEFELFSNSYNLFLLAMNPCFVP